MYNFKEIESKWKNYWYDNNTFKTDINDFSRPKFYCLDMFPYPSGSGLHAGNAEGYTASDVISRMKRMQGFNVLHPIGFDAFGLPAEQYAIETGNHPSIITKKNIEIFTQQLKTMGFSYDWDRVISTADPEYYKWTQWIFKQLFLDKLAYKIEMPVNWCEGLGCVLANDEIVDGKSERGGFSVVRKNMSQWVIDMPAYAEKLLSGLETVEWPSSTKEIQKNWIGKSIGAEVIFNVKNSEYNFKVFTTRCDTLFGTTYCVLSPEHELIEKITSDDKKEEVKNYKRECALKSDLERTELNKEKTGVFTGAYAINPVNNKEIPIWISDYVLVTYGTGAIMAVPAHDERDYAFAKKYNLEIVPVLKGGNIENQAYTEDGIHINSDFLNNLNKEDAINKMLNWLEEKNFGTKKINYKIREWIFARQRYWGEPIPIINYDNNTHEALVDEELPLVLPELDDYAPSKNGDSPLEKASSWINVNYNDKIGKRETSTMPGSAGSSWYFLRYIDPHNNSEFADKKLLEHWMPVDLYIGGPEHAVGHLLYSRMWNNYLFDKGLVPCKEPFNKLVHQGMILGANGIKMGKRYPEYVVNPSDIASSYGVDTLRMYEMFMGPLEADKPWSNSGIEGSKRFVDKIWRLYMEDNIIVENNTESLETIYHQTVKKVTDDYETLNINTAISAMMIFINRVYKEKEISKEYAIGLLKLLNPLIPFITEEIWHEKFNQDSSLSLSSWPQYDENKTIIKEKEIGVQVNGKLRATIKITDSLSEEEILKIAKSEKNVLTHIDNKTIIKEIVIPNRIVNIVVK